MIEKKKFGELVMSLENEGFEVSQDESYGYYVIEDIEGHICTMEVKTKQVEDFQENLSMKTMIYIMDGEANTTVHPVEKVDSIIYTVLDALDYDFEEVES